MDDFEKRKLELMQPLLIEAGASLYDCQHFEYGIALLLFHLSRVGTEGLDFAKMSLIMEDKEKHTAGALIKMLKKHVTVSPGIEDALEQALAARNLLIHRMLVDNVERLPAAESRAALVKEIRKLRAKVQKADTLLRPFIMGFSKTLDGVDERKFEAEFRQRLS
jgi:hypothetical protein